MLQSWLKLLFRLSIGILIFCLSTLWMYNLSIETTKLLQNESKLSKNESLTFPSNLDELKVLASLLKTIYQKNSNFIYILFCSAYLYKQTFAIPGSVFLNLLAGSLFGLYHGLFICCTLTTLGALGCFFLSKFCFKALVKKFFGNKLRDISNKTKKLNTYSLLSYLLSIRLFPASPNWLINISCPIVGVSWYLFAISVYFGLIPYIYLCVQTGEILSEITSTNQIFTPSILLKSSLVAFAALLPSFFMKKRQQIKKK